MNKARDEYNGKYDEWKTATGVAIGIAFSFGWTPIYGWTPLALAAHKADTLRKAWKQLWNSYTALESNNKEENQLIAFLTTLVGQFNDVGKKIQGAIDAVGTLGAMLQDQADAYSGIDATLQSLGAHTLGADASNRQLFIKGKLDVTVKKLEDLRNASQGFMDAILNEDPNFGKTMTPA